MNISERNELTKQVNSYLEKHEIKSISKVRQDLQPFLNNRNSPKSNMIHGSELIKHIRDRVQVSMENAGVTNINEQASAITTVSTEVYQWLINSKYKHITLAEITDAFRRGGSGEYESENKRIFGYGADRFTKYIRGYMDCNEREIAMKEWLKKQDEELITDNPVMDLFKPNLDIALMLFDIFKENPKLIKGTVLNHEDTIYHIPAIFNFLIDNFEINISNETKKKVVESGKKKYWEFIKSGLSKKELQEGKLQLLIDSVKSEHNKTLDNYCDVEGLLVLFNGLITRNKSVSDLKRK